MKYTRIKFMLKKNYTLRGNIFAMSPRKKRKKNLEISSQTFSFYSEAFLKG